jgi:DNA-binding response OmpR family regulator
MQEPRDDALRDGPGRRRSCLRKVLRAYLQEAVEHVRAARPDLVVLDVRMPGFDGFEVLRRLEAAGLRTAVMMLTSVSDELDQLVAYRLARPGGASAGP